MKVALVYDRVNKFGGAERVLLALHEIWPEAPLYTSVYDPAKAPWAKVFPEIRTSFLQKIPILPKDRHEYYPFLMGLAFEQFNFDEFDVVISVSHEFAKAIITKPSTLHLCYCLTPVGYLWSGYESYFSGKSKLLKLLISPIVKWLRFYDQVVCHRPDVYVAISETVKERIKKYYDRECEVVYPPVETTKKSAEADFRGSAKGSLLTGLAPVSRMIPKAMLLSSKTWTAGESSPSEPGANPVLEPFAAHAGNSITNYFLVVSRLVPNKRVDIAIEAFNQLSWPLKIVGTGVEEKRLQKMAGLTVEFLGSLTDPELASYYRHCRALIVPGEEDFGITAVEAQSFGKPVVAFSRGGALETVWGDKTGWFFQEQTPEALVELLKRVDFDKINPAECRQNARRFGKVRFLREFRDLVKENVIRYRQKTH